MQEINIHILQHEPFEGAGLLEEWAKERGHKLSVTLVYENQVMPSLNAFDWLIIMGGAMSANDEEEYAWIKAEKEVIKQSVEQGKAVIGICLGSQMIASALGKAVYKNKMKEIGWFPLHLTDEGMHSEFLSPEWNDQLFLHWHGETFDLPEGAAHLAFSAGCVNQAFCIGNKVFGFQFHPETNLQTLAQMVNSGAEELIKDKFVMEAKEILKRASIIDSTRILYFKFLDKVAMIEGQKSGIIT